MFIKLITVLYRYRLLHGAERVQPNDLARKWRRSVVLDWSTSLSLSADSQLICLPLAAERADSYLTRSRCKLSVLACSRFELLDNQQSWSSCPERVQVSFFLPILQRWFIVKNSTSITDILHYSVILVTWSC